MARNSAGKTRISVLSDDRAALLLDAQEVPHLTLFDPDTGFTTPEVVGDATGYGEGVVATTYANDTYGALVMTYFE